jgi:hypothetical protein
MLPTLKHDTNIASSPYAPSSSALDVPKPTPTAHTPDARHPPSPKHLPLPLTKGSQPPPPSLSALDEACHCTRVMTAPSPTAPFLTPQAHSHPPHLFSPPPLDTCTWPGRLKWPSVKFTRSHTTSTWLLPPTNPALLFCP